MEGVRSYPLTRGLRLAGGRAPGSDARTCFRLLYGGRTRASMIMFPPLSTIYVENVPEYFYKLPVYNLIVTITHPTVSFVLPNNAIVTRYLKREKLSCME